MPTFTQKSPQGSEKGSEGQVRLTHSPASTTSPAATPSPASESKPSSSSSAAPASKEPMFTIYFFHNDSSIKFVFTSAGAQPFAHPPTQRKPLAAKREAFSKLVLRN